MSIRKRGKKHRKYVCIGREGEGEGEGGGKKISVTDTCKFFVWITTILQLPHCLMT